MFANKTLALYGVMTSCALVAVLVYLRSEPDSSTWQQIAHKIAGNKMNTSSGFIARQLQQGKKANRLINEKSPYLLQHAFNPVDWYAWGDEAFEKARAEDKPIFLSVGYSTCHWCHVMEHESFEDSAIAALMNEYFVCIKVDREERPDVDKVYMAAVQAMTGSGGWPMSVWLTPDLKPFFGGTYFPPAARYGRAGFPDVLKRIHELWVDERVKLMESAQQMSAMLQSYASVGAPDSALDDSLLGHGYQAFRASYDPQFGGFGGAPKFPRPSVFNFLLRYHRRSGAKEALEMSLHTLRQMARGGMYDQIGGGFHRYSVDEQWRVPHFEKMLYDQAQLVCSYIDAYQITGDEYFSKITRDVLNYVQRDMTDANGGFFSAEDADSAPDSTAPDHKVEGAFYLWRLPEVEALLGKEAATIFSAYYDIREGGNALADPQGEFGDGCILYVANDAAEMAKKSGKRVDEIEQVLREGRQKLFAAREKRLRPHLDDKILTSWNGLMISAFARAAQALDEPRYLSAAQNAARFILEKLYDPHSQNLLRRFRDGEAKFPAHLDDYAFFAQGLIDLYETDFDFSWLAHAKGLTEAQVRLFWDEQDGGFFDNAGNDKSILLRAKEDYDGAEPSGNAVAAMNLLRLSQFLNRDEWREMAEKTLNLFSGRVAQIPTARPQMLAAVDLALAKPRQIIIAGDRHSPDTQALLHEVRRRYLPNNILLIVDGHQTVLAEYVPVVKSMTQLDGRATAYVCEDFACELPTNDPEKLAQLLTGKTVISNQ
jgi:uncharacterized protein YyaL (SSP411 family)